MPLGGSARRCSSSSRRWPGQPCSRTGPNARLHAFGRPAGRTPRNTDESPRPPSWQPLRGSAGSRSKASWRRSVPPGLLSEPLEVDDWTTGTLGGQIADPVSEDEYERVMEQLVTEQVRALTDALDDRQRQPRPARGCFERRGSARRARRRRTRARAQRAEAQRNQLATAAGTRAARAA